MGSTTTSLVSYTLLSHPCVRVPQLQRASDLPPWDQVITLCDGFHNYNQSLGQLHSVDGFLQLQLDHEVSYTLCDGFHNYRGQVTYLLGIKLSLCVMGSTTTTNHWVSYTLLMGSYNYNQSLGSSYHSV